MMHAQNQSPQLVKERQISPEQIELIKRTICKDATDDELKLFLSVCDKKQLDPFTNQIYAVKRWNSQQRKFIMTFQTSIDGFRLIAERSGKYAGQLGPLWSDDEGNWSDIWLFEEPPFAAKVAILREDFKEPLWSVAKFGSFVQKTKEGRPNSFWAKMPEHQIAKVAEAQAIRRAFPHELSGLYIEDELPTAEVIDPEEHEVNPRPTAEIYSASTPQKQLLCEVLRECEITNVGLMAEISRRLTEASVLCEPKIMKEWIKSNVKPEELAQAE